MFLAKTHLFKENNMSYVNQNICLHLSVFVTDQNHHF